MELVVVGTTQRFGIPMGYGGPRCLLCNQKIINVLCQEELSEYIQDADGNRALAVWHYKHANNTST
jgi:glycine cleavage system pyridoxal-binding protein P